METPVLLIIFNRPESTQLVFNAIKKSKPKFFFIAADGPRIHQKGEYETCMLARSVLKQIDWECNVKTLFHDENLGCFRAVNKALSWFFSCVEYGIILEDDCLPSDNFFKFMEWGLHLYKNDSQIGMITGSNLIDFKCSSTKRNGFSNLINIWGWASWRRVWIKHDPYLTIKSIQLHRNIIQQKMRFNWWQKIYWKELFKFTVYLGSTWDFQLQHSFFRMNLLTVYPCRNLIFNIGFSGDGTHTNIDRPSYVIMSKPVDNYDILQYTPDLTKMVDFKRDNILAKKIWYYTPFTAIKLKIMNTIRLNM